MGTWDTAYGWGDHAAQTYIKNIAPLHVDIPNLKVGINQASPVVDFQVGTTMYVNNTAGKVGIGIAVPTSQLEINGDLQIDSSVEARLKFYHSGSSAHTLSEITAEKDGTNGGDLHFYTKVNNGNVTEKLRINNIGAIGIGATPNYGTANQFLKSNNSGSAVSWDTPTDTTYSATGTGLSLTGTIFQNTAPDQTVTLTGTGGTTTSGTYPSFTINSTDTNTTYSATGTGLSLTGTAFQNTAPDQVVTLTGTGGTTTSGTYPNFTINSTDTDTTYVGGTAITVTNNAISNDAPDQIVVLTGTGGTTTSGTYPSFTINSTDTNTTYSAGLNMSLVGTEFNIPQSIGTFDSPSFNTLTLGNGGANLGVINLRDTTNIGIETVAQMKGILNVTNGGQLEFQTKVNGGILTKKMVISENGKTEFFTDTGTISILSADGTSQQSFIYNDTNGTRDLTFDCYSAVTNKGISFLTGGVRRMRITNTGEFLFGASNSAGNTNDVLTSSGGVGPPYWAPVAVQGGVYTGGLGISVTNNVISIDNVVVNTYANQQISGNKSFTDAMGIGITGASSWPLRVAQYGATIGGSLGQYVYGNGGWGYAGYYWSSSNPTDAIGLYVDEGIRCGRQFILSDRRIKKDIIDINDEQALLKLRLLKPKRYKYIDPRRGTDEVYGFIAQEVAEVIPYSVNLEKSYIPSHMVFCKIITTTTTTTTLDTKVPHNLTTTDVISIRDSSHVLTEDIKVVEIINDKTLKIDKVFTTTETTFIASSGQTETNVIFLYGKKVADLHAINKDTIWTTATAALQEVDRQLQAEKIKTLNLTSRLEALEARLLALESK